MIIIHKKKALFIHIHRTGGSSIISLLKKALPNQVDVIAQHGNASTMEKQLLTTYADYFIFSIVRNPWDRLLSWYSLLHKSDPTPIEAERLRFEQFLLTITHDDGNDSSLCNQLDYFNTLNLDKIHIYRYEQYAKETQRMAKKLGITITDIPRVNETSSKNYQDYYTKKSKALVTEKCARDIAYFGYTF